MGSEDLSLRLRLMGLEEDECKSVDSDVETLDDDDDDCGYSDSIDSGKEDSGDLEEGIVSEDDSDTTEDDLGEESYRVLMEEDLRNQQQEDITKVSNTLYIPLVLATILLRHYNWDVIKAQDAWFADEEKVRKDLGLLEEQVEVPIQNMESIIKCRICFDDVARDDMCAANCGHLFCDLCWTQYVSIKIVDGPGCLSLRCPDPSCAAAVGQDMVDQLVSDEDKDKYSRYLFRSYVEDRRKMSKWCPGPGCEFAIEFFAGSSSYDVVCNCGHSFCWKCVEDAHRPVDCDTVHNWAVKNTAESENVTWILANSKSCPECKKPIEKNQGCMHMTCSCGFEFCWLCLGDWKTHGEGTGGFYACNVYEQAKSEGKYDEEEQIRKMAKDYMDRYAFYYERFAQNQKSRLKTFESLQKMRSDYLEKLSDKYVLTDTMLGFLSDAWLQIIEGRRVLKWSYVYGYYLPTSEHAKKAFFECLQGEAQYWLERLHQWAEYEIRTYLTDDAPTDFNPFRIELQKLTSFTRTVFETLVRAIENGLSEVDSRTAVRQTGSFFQRKESKEETGVACHDSKSDDEII